MSQKAFTDVLVSGAGPVGMISALLLAESGVRTAVIDRGGRPATHSYACGLHPRSLELLDQLGLLPEVTQASRRINKVAFYSGQGREAEVDLSALPVKFPYILVLPQNVLETLLATRLSKAHCEVLWHHRLSDLHREGSEVIAEIDQLAGTGTGYIVPRWELVVRRTVQMNAAYVIGADGSRSAVRNLIGIEREQVAEPEYYVVYEIESDARLADELCVVLDKGAKSVLWPLPEGRCRWSFQLAEVDEITEFSEKDRDAVWGEPTTIAQRTLNRLKQRLAERAPWFDANVQKVNWAVDIQFPRQLAKVFGRERCWLAGDAAHQTSPAGIQSMNIGLLEGAELAGILKKILREKGSTTLLDNYERTHRGEWQQLLGMKGAPKSGAAASAWVKEHCCQIPPCLPASGNELALLLSQLGLTLP